MSLDRDTHDRAMTTAHPATLGDTLPAHLAFRLRRLISTAQATIDRDGHHGYLTVACEPAHVTYTDLDHVEVTVHDTGDPDAGTRKFRVTVEAIDDDPTTPDTDGDVQSAPQAYVIRGCTGVRHYFSTGTVVYPIGIPVRCTAGYYSTDPPHLRGVDSMHQFVSDCDVEPIDDVDDSGLPDGTCTCGHDDCGAC